MAFFHQIIEPQGIEKKDVKMLVLKSHQKVTALTGPGFDISNAWTCELVSNNAILDGRHYTPRSKIILTEQVCLRDGIHPLYLPNSSVVIHLESEEVHSRIRNQEWDDILSQDPSSNYAVYLQGFERHQKTVYEERRGRVLPIKEEVHLAFFSSEIYARNELTPAIQEQSQSQPYCNLALPVVAEEYAVLEEYLAKPIRFNLMLEWILPKPQKDNVYRLFPPK